MNYIQHATQWMVGLLFPVRCVRCGAFGEHPTDFLCTACAETIPCRTNACCIGCGAPSHNGATCAACRPHWQLDRFLAATDYRTPPMAEAIAAYKYEFVRGLAQPLADIMVRFLAERRASGMAVLPHNMIIVPVPLTPYRTRWRGFNQAQLLAEHIATRTLLPLRPDVLTRTRRGTPQAQIDRREERLQRMHGQFTCATPDAVHGNNILLIDDVATTGATLNACADALESAGAKSVSALVLAHGD